MLDKKQHRLIGKPIRCLIADAGYRDKKRATDLDAAKIMLITPDMCVKHAEALLGRMDAMAVAVFNAAKQARKIAIEPIFDLLSKLLETQGRQKPLPVSGWHPSPPFGDLE